MNYHFTKTLSLKSFKNCWTNLFLVNVLVGLCTMISQHGHAAHSGEVSLRSQTNFVTEGVAHNDNLVATCPTFTANQLNIAIPSESPTTNNSYIDASLPDAHILRQAVKNTEKSTFHLFSHGRPGELLINGQWLSKEGIANFINDKLKAKSQQPTAIHIYGCNFAQSAIGRAAVAYLEKELGISIAASTNLTGVDGDWTLEIGQQSLDVDNYSHILQTNLLSNTSFESVVIPNNSESNTATITDWTRTVGDVYLGRGATSFAGVNSNFNTSPQHIIFDGVDALSQTFTAPSPGYYRFFVRETRQENSFPSQPANPIQVRIDGNVVGTFTPDLFRTQPFIFQFQLTSGGAHTVELRSTVASGAFASMLDDVGIYFFSSLEADPTGAISGAVFRDYNGNGIQDNMEPLMPGITVNAYDAANNLCGTAVTSGGAFSPNYSLSGCGTGPVRVEFVLPNGEPLVDAGIDYSSLSGTTYGTSVQFVNGNSSDVNFAISNPDDYNVGSPEVELFLPCYVSGDPLAGGATGTSDWFVSFDYPAASSTPMPTRKVDGTALGATWGTAYSKQADRIFTSAVLKRHIGLGPMGTGGIYMLEPTATSFNVTEFYDMDANGHRTRAGAGAPAYGDGTSYNIMTNGFGAGVEVNYLGGSDPVSGQPVGLGVVGSNVQRGLSPSPTVPDYDPAAFDQVGKVGLGGLEISDDGRFLFVMNLYSRSVFRLELDDPANPMAVVNVTEISLPAPSCANGEFRPWALTYHRGKLYAGGVCSAENGGTRADMEAYVLEMDNPATGTAFATTPVLSFPLDYQRYVSFRFFRWSNQVDFATASGYFNDPTPLLSDLTFGNNGQMVINLMDRFGLQQQSQNYIYLSNRTDLEFIRTSVDMLVAGLDATMGNYQLESDQRYTTNGITYLGNNANETHFFNDNGGFAGNTLGSSVYLPGLQGGVTATQFNSSSQNAYNLSLLDGRQWPIEFVIADGAPGVEEKGLGLGELDLSGPDIPLEIGNRVWVDTDNDGVQDPNEAVIPGVEVQLWKEDSPGSGTFSQIATVTTDANGEYYFTSATGTSTTGITYGVTDLLPEMNYELRFPTTTTVGMDVLSLTAVNMGGSDPNADVRDSDADISTGVVSFMTGELGANDHSFDVGFAMVMVANLEMEKTFISATPNGDGTFTVDYTITVMETNGVPTTYDLTDEPGFDDDITINSGSFSGQNSGMLMAGLNSLAAGESIAANATHTYNLSFNVTLDLMDGLGDNIYNPCDVTMPMPGEGLYNIATLTTGGMSGDDEACGDLPPDLALDKTFVDATPNGDGTFTVTYTVTVENSGGAAGTYDLEDTPGFDDDIAINSGSFSGQNSGTLMAGTNSLATGESIAGGATHTYNLSFVVTLDLTDGVGDDVYTACDGTSPVSGEGLFNEASLSTNGTTIEAEDCGDLPNITVAKIFDSATSNGDGTFTVTYTVTVENSGGAAGTYDLEDTPAFDDDIAINSGSFSGQNSGTLTTGTNTLATGESISAGATHTYKLSFVVTLDLTDGVGDDVYTACDGTSPVAGEGLFNEASLSTNGTTIEAEDCGDLPNITIAKTFDSATPNGDGTFTVTYTVTVENTGGAAGSYDLEDTPGFDDDIAINSGSFSGQNSGTLTTGTNTLATGESIAAGATHTYNLSFVVTLDLTDGAGDNIYTACDGTSPVAGEGLFNSASLTTNGTTIEAEACGDLPNITVAKVFDSATPNGDGTFTVTYTVTVENTGGAAGTYDLEDTPGFDDDIAINSGSFSGQNSGTLTTGTNT